MNGRTAKLIRRASRAYGVPVKDIKRIWYSLNWKERTEARREMKADVARYQERRSEIQAQQSADQTESVKNTETKQVREHPENKPTPSRTDRAAAGSHNPINSRWRSFIGWIKRGFGWLIPITNKE